MMTFERRNCTVGKMCWQITPREQAWCAGTSESLKVISIHTFNSFFYIQSMVSPEFQFSRSQNAHKLPL